MTNFSESKILHNLEYIGQELRTAREGKGLGLANAATRVGIKAGYLSKMESGQFDQLPAGVYRRNFLREYAVFLRLDASSLLECYEQEIEPENAKANKDLFSKQVAKAHYFLSIPKMIKTATIIGIILVCLSYLGFGMKKFVSAPDLSVTSPAGDIVTKDNNMEIKGITEPEAQISINGESVLANTAGYFTKMVNLKEGINIVTVTARKNYGEERTVRKQILVKR